MRRKGNRVKQARSNVYTSNCETHTVRGNPKQIVEKYISLAGEHIGHEKENFLQMAEHWQRVLNRVRSEQSSRQQQ